MALTLAPLLASYWLLDEVLNSAIGLAVKTEHQQLLEHYRDDLKTLRERDPDNEATYKARFLQASDELLIYQQPELLRQVLRDTYLTYYLVIFVVILFCAFVCAVWLNQKVARSYNRLVARDIKKAQKIRELSYFDEWQTIASKLAHEINNPLTPIEMMVSNLQRLYGTTDPAVFKASLQDTQSVVREEVQKLKEMVAHFSQFAKLPEPNLKNINLMAHCHAFIRQYQHAWPQAEIKVVEHDNPGNAPVALDPLLFNQCLLNLLNNAVQANQTLAHIDINLSIKVENNHETSLTVFNTGETIKEEESARIFQMYYSKQSSDDNMGLGLSIVKKILLDHGGDIACLPVKNGAAFKITLPSLSKTKPTNKSDRYEH